MSLIVLVGVGGIIVLHGNLCVSSVRARIISMGVIRCLIGMSIGCLSNMYKEKLFKNQVIFWGSIFVIIVEMVFMPKTAADVIILIAGAVFIIEADLFSTTAVGLKKKFATYLGRLSYIVFLIQGFTMPFYEYSFESFSLSFYLAGVLLLSVLVDFILESIIKFSKIHLANTV